MNRKTLDTTFIHYGIRRDDMRLIETLCTQHDLEPDWVREDLLKEFHTRKVKDEEIGEKALERLIDKALQKIK